MTDDKLSQRNQFTGTEHWYKNPLFPNLRYTDGVRYVAEEDGAYWLIDKIFSLQHIAKICAEQFQVWKLNVIDDGAASLTIEDGDGTPIYTETISYTDFPSYGVTFYLTDSVLLLPSEY